MSLRVLNLRLMGETMSDDGLRFPETFHYQAGIGQRSSSAYFGTDVLSGLVTGMDEFLTDPEGRWRQFRSLGAAVLGCVPWLDDPALLSAIDRFPSACGCVISLGSHLEVLPGVASRGSARSMSASFDVTGDSAAQFVQAESL